MSKLAGRWCEIAYAGYRLTGYSTQFDITHGMGEMDLTTFMDAVKHGGPNYVWDDTAALTLFMDADTDASHDALNGKLAQYTNSHLLILVGQGAAPGAGDPCYLLSAKHFVYTVPVETEAAIVCNTTFRGQGPGQWGVVLANYLATAITNSFTGSAIDQGAQSGDGAEAILQVVLPTSSDTYDFIVQDSPDNSVWSDLITFTADGQTRLSERQTITGTVERYIRVIATRTGAAGDELKFAVGFKRY